MTFLSVAENPKSIKPEFADEIRDSSTILENSGADHRDKSKANLTIRN